MESITYPLYAEITKLTNQRNAYAKAINRIDDYFEYRNSSPADGKYVHEVLSNLTIVLGKIK